MNIDFFPNFKDFILVASADQSFIDLHLFLKSYLRIGKSTLYTTTTVPLNSFFTEVCVWGNASERTPSSIKIFPPSFHPSPLIQVYLSVKSRHAPSNWAVTTQRSGAGIISTNNLHSSFFVALWARRIHKGYWTVCYDIRDTSHEKIISFVMKFMAHLNILLDHICTFHDSRCCSIISPTAINSLPLQNARISKANGNKV